jgi:fructose/tagatose bisphosphate aldolase
MNYFFGVMTKNQVDSIIQFSLENPKFEITFIPSRRQIEYDCGYVNNWTTKTFSEYVKNKNFKIKIMRDHGGPGQGLSNDDGYLSLNQDCKYFDLIHIDPWKKYSDIDKGIEWTIDMINYCYSINKNIEYEIGTEEAIRPFTIEELEYVIKNIKNKLDENIFQKIKYCVVQCGNSLCNGKNSDKFDKAKLTEMIHIVKKYNFISKEHNGDWVSIERIKQKKELGLDCINIAPEFGMIETSVILSKIKENKQEYDNLYNLCFESGKWKKWINSDFDFINQKDDLILITGHYIFSNEKFKPIKSNYPNIDNEIKEHITNKLLQLYFIYDERSRCIFCNNDDLEILFNKNYSTSLSLGLYNKKNTGFFMPYNIQICKTCFTFQNKYIGDLSIIYSKNHVDDYGTTKSRKHTSFCNFILENDNINGIIEVGACNGILAKEIMKNKHIDYNIIEPSFTGDKMNLNIISDYFENVELNIINSNTLIMSDVFEHFYNPISILNKIWESDNIKYLFLNHPDFDYTIKNDIMMNLNCEHTFLIEHQFLFDIFEKYGFKLNRRFDFENFSLFLEFERITTPENSSQSYCNNKLYIDRKIYFDKIISNVKKINHEINNNIHKKYYIWPSSIHSVQLFTFGLNYKRLEGILDNSPNKIGKYLYGYNILCSSFDNLLKNGDDTNVVFISNAANYIKELDLQDSKVQLIFINEL